MQLYMSGWPDLCALVPDILYRYIRSNLHRLGFCAEVEIFLMTVYTLYSTSALINSLFLYREKTLPSPKNLILTYIPVSPRDSERSRTRTPTVSVGVAIPISLLELT